jgi:glycosyltransferase involved in cell wall biosynthesis
MGMKPFWCTKAIELREKLKIPSRDKIILYVGSLVPEKKVDKLLQAFHRCVNEHPDWHLVIVGDGPGGSDLESYCEKDSVPNVRFAGRIVEEVYAYFTMCDVFVLPGLGGLAINDAMMCGKPVICGEADGTEKDLIIDGTTGYLLHSQDDSIVNEIIQKLELVLTTKALLGVEGAIVKHYIETASFTHMIDMLERAIRVNL